MLKRSIIQFCQVFISGFCSSDVWCAYFITYASVWDSALVSFLADLFEIFVYTFNLFTNRFSWNKILVYWQQKDIISVRTLFENILNKSVDLWIWSSVAKFGVQCLLRLWKTNPCPSKTLSTCPLGKLAIDLYPSFPLTLTEGDNLNNLGHAWRNLQCPSAQYWSRLCFTWYFASYLYNVL